jgi:hypothetical protein
MRLKIIAGNLIVVLVVGLVSYFVVQSQLKESLGAQVEQEIANDVTLFDRSWRLSSRQFLDYVEDRATSQPVRDAFGGLDENSRRQRAHQAANGVAQWFRDPARGRGGAPDLVAITDETGRVIARNQDPNRMYGAQLTSQLPLLRAVLSQTELRHDVWLKTDENKLLQIGMAPIVSDQGAVLGALVVGYDLSNGLATSEAQVLGRDVAFIVADNVYSSSLGGSGPVQALKGHLFGPLAADTNAALEGSGSQPWHAQIGGDEWVGVTAPLPLAPSMNVAYAVMANKTESMALAGAATIILILTVLGAILVLLYGFLIGTSFIRPVEQIEEGVLAVINGRTDLRIDVESAEFGGLAYRINQLINVFTGVSEEDDEGRVSRPPARPGGWSEEQAMGDGGGGGAGPAAPGEPIDDPAVASQLGAEPEDAYLSRIYQEYVQAKAGVGETINIPQDRFSQRLQGNADALAKKHGVAGVRFRVEVAGNQVVLRPVLLR